MTHNDNNTRKVHSDIIFLKYVYKYYEFFNQIEDKDKVISFVKRQLDNSRNATKTKAERFLRKLDMSR
jgi:hypothetical protein